MIVRTAPVLLPVASVDVVRVPVNMDVVRVLERLESQLRRAADDLATSLPDLRMAADAELESARRLMEAGMRERLEQEVLQAAGRCGKSMKEGRRCHRKMGHDWEHRSREAMDNKRRVAA